MRLMSALFATLMASPAFAQANPPPPAEGGGEPLALLMFFTIGIVFLIAVASFLYFLRKRPNREAVNRGINPNHPSNKQ